jgi:hypothetical protein
MMDESMAPGTLWLVAILANCTRPAFLYLWRNRLPNIIHWLDDKREVVADICAGHLSGQDTQYKSNLCYAKN